MHLLRRQQQRTPHTCLPMNYPVAPGCWASEIPAAHRLTFMEKMTQQGCDEVTHLAGSFGSGGSSMFGSAALFPVRLRLPLEMCSSVFVACNAIAQGGRLQMTPNAQAQTVPLAGCLSGLQGAPCGHRLNGALNDELNRGQAAARSLHASPARKPAAVWQERKYVSIVPSWNTRQFDQHTAEITARHRLCRQSSIIELAAC